MLIMKCLCFLEVYYFKALPTIFVTFVWNERGVHSWGQRLSAVGMWGSCVRDSTARCSSKQARFHNAEFWIAFIGPEGNEDDDGYTKMRNKRQAEQYEYTPTKTRCPLLLVADYRFYQEMGGSNTKTTINYLVRIYALLSKFIKCWWMLSCLHVHCKLH
jgi:hypothetical protein